MSTPSSVLAAPGKQGKGGVSHSSSSSMSASSIMPGSSKSTSSCSGKHSREISEISPATKRKTLAAETHHGTQLASTVYTTPEHKQHSLLEALVPVNLELPSQRNSILESDESTGDGQKVLRRAGDALELLLSKGQELLEQEKRKGEV